MKKNSTPKKRQWKNGILALPNGKYKARYNLGLIERNGKMIMVKPCKTFDTEKEASQWRTAQLFKKDVAYKDGEQRASERTIAQMIDDYFKSPKFKALRKKEVNSNSEKTTERVVLNFKDFCDLNANQVRTVEQFDANMAEQFVSYAIDNFEGHGIFKLIGKAKELFERERLFHGLKQNPFWVIDIKGLRKSHLKPKSPRVLSREERVAFLSHLTERDYHLLVVLFLGGFRPKAIRYMRRVDVDLESKEMTEREHSQGQKDHYIPKGKGKTVPLTGQLLESVIWFMDKTVGKKYAFNLAHDGPMGDQYILRACKRAVKGAAPFCPSLIGVTPRVLRATCGSIIKMAGGTHFAQTALAHESERTTSLYYINDSDKDYRDKAFTLLEQATKDESWRMTFRSNPAQN